MVEPTREKDDRTSECILANHYVNTKNGRKYEIRNIVEPNICTLLCMRNAANMFMR